MKQLYLTFIFITLSAVIFSSQYFFDQDKRKLPTSEPIVLSSQVVKAADLGLHNAASDLAWLASIQYFGGRSSTNYQKLDDYLKLATKLDPNFSYPYAFAALILPSLGQVDRSIDFATEGIEKGKPNWQIPYYLAVTYHVNKKDFRNAAYYFDIAAHTQGAPAGVKKIAANYGANPDSRDQTKQIWLSIYENSNDEVVRERATTYIMHFEIMSFLEEAAKKYRAINGKLPLQASDLVPSILKEVPVDPFGFQYKFDETGRAVVQ